MLAPRTAALCAAEYRAQQLPGAVVIFAVGVHPVSGYSIFWERSIVAPLVAPELSLWHVPPAGIIERAVTPFAVHLFCPAPANLRAVVVSDAEGRHEVSVEQVSAATARHGQS